MSEPQKIIVIGGGAAGFMGAIACAEGHPHAQVTILEAGREPLTKVKISGGGRCNVTHSCFDPAILVQHYPRGGKALRGPFSRFQPQDTIDWFGQRQIKLKTEADGRMFPTTDDSMTIVECLMESAKAARAKLYAGAAVKTIEKIDNSFQITLRSGQVMAADKVLLATGSSPQGHAIATSLGHTIESPVPSLFTFNIKDSRIEGLAGVAVNPGQVKLQIGKHKLEQTGPVLITHWGLSGPAVLKLSAWGARILHNAKYNAKLTINWLPKHNLETLNKELLMVKGQLPRRVIATSCPVMIPKRLWESLTLTAGIASDLRWADLPKKSLNKLMLELIQGQYQITGKGVFKEEFVTCGGVPLKQVNFKTMESKICPGLYFAGEVLDIDGVTGGFNFQSAWTTGWLAGQAMSEITA
ncbi:NAD(P)/FAD-dependent oxidoreductase [filamentous cyanobacterium LEGE 11480]|uniref:NAD(P)/FAD-dependent oxidoreductase n=1 Tax=Romeriopsis navalis LEGE 11480 TaxID=2777977 RepID=A0A928VNG4_9CYAN|nr:NAD(P)/FAD-dependent oxidoreductase [Romeriopsis navalis]MBE9030837.1 NAD(P)/FAD-dependent oxidoreductase [Romeriopsis navalis LEGE 11480]